MTNPSLSPLFLRQFFQLALVNILSNLLVPLAGLIDVAFLGHLSEIRHLAGVALATVIFNYIYWTFGFLRMSTTGLTAQAVGRGDRDTVWLIGLRHGILALGIGVLILLLQYPLQLLGFTLLHATAEVKAAGVNYYNALIWGAPANLMGFVLIGWFLGRAESGKVLVLSAVNSMTNVLFDYLFIVQWGWGSAGAGGATAISQYLMLGVGLLFLGRQVNLAHIRTILPQLYDPTAIRSAFTLNGAILVRTFALVTTFAVFTNLSAALGTVALTANTLMLQVVTFSAYFIDGLAFATESVAGILQGRRSTTGLWQLVRVSGSMSLALGLLFATMFIVLPHPLFGLLTDHTNILDYLAAYVPWLLPVLGFGSIAYMLDGYFLGLTQGRILRNASLLSSLVGFAPIAFLSWQTQSNHLLWLALAGFMAARTLTLGVNLPNTFRN